MTLELENFLCFSSHAIADFSTALLWCIYCKMVEYLATISCIQLFLEINNDCNRFQSTLWLILIYYVQTMHGYMYGILIEYFMYVRPILFFFAGGL